MTIAGTQNTKSKLEKDASEMRRQLETMIQAECDLAEDVLTSNDYYVEMSEEVDESAIGKEAKMYLAAKRHLVSVVAELAIAMENKATLPARPPQWVQEMRISIQ